MPSQTIASEHRSVTPPTHEPLQPADFVGFWQVRRRLVDHLGRKTLGFTGQARIETMSITETGEMHSSHGTLEAKRLYLLEMDAAGVDVRFAGGAHFVHLGLAPDQRVLQHCGDDLYEGRFIFRSRDCWIEFWRVSGPRKRYASLTRYERIPDPA